MGAPGTTPGHWVTQKWSPKERAIVTRGDDGKPHLITGYALEADAYQLAASSDLYDAAETARDLFQRLQDDYPPSSVGREWVDNAISTLNIVLARARGESC